MDQTDGTDTAPVSARERIQSIDTLRGVALLGILLLNIIGFALPLAAYSNPAVDGSTQGVNLAVYTVVEVFAEGSMRALFSMLFGAGMLIFLAKPTVDSLLVKSLFYRRTTILIVFGLVNAYVFLWFGDILFAYGVTGLLLYLFRDLAPARLISYAAIILLFLTALHTTQHYSTKQLRSEVLAVEALPEEIEKSAEQQAKLAEWDQFLIDQFASKDLIEADIATRQGTYLENLIAMAQLNLLIQTLGFLAGNLWDVLAMMLLGMAFMKLGIFDASRSFRFYTALMLTGFAVGLTVNSLEVKSLIDSGFEIYWAGQMRPSYEIGRLAVALGYIGLVMLICKAGLLSRLRKALAAVGQMALSNYLSQSLICNIVFMGFGFGLIGQLERHQIYYVVFAVWIFQLISSSVWLKYYRFGPAEWLWRSLTYKKIQSLRL